jgi:hypothetical protein
MVRGCLALLVVGADRVLVPQKFHKRPKTREDAVRRTIEYGKRALGIQPFSSDEVAEVLLVLPNLTLTYL